MRGSPKDTWNASQIVAHNLTKARELRGLTQGQVAERMAEFTEAKWTSTSVAQAEGSVSGSRIRAFTAVELFALARTFDLPVLYFLAPPEPGQGVGLEMPGVPTDAWEYLVLLVAGHYDNAEALGEQYANFARTLVTDIPLDNHTRESIEQFGSHHRTSEVRLHPTDVLAAAMHGLTVRGMRGAPHPGTTLDDMIKVLEQLQYALMALRNYRPAEFVNQDVAEGLSNRRADK